jgi:hypothetical protein
MNTPPWIILLSIVDKLPKDYVSDKWAERVQECYACEYLNGKRCSICYCTVDKMALIKTKTCPKGKW